MSDRPGPRRLGIARRARELDPHMPVVYVSGGGAFEWPSKGVPNSVMIAKPFAVARLITAVTLVLVEAELVKTARARLLLLLVEDNPVILDLLDGELTDAGFDVVVAGRGAYALAEINTNVGRFSAVIIDIKLDPLGSDGWEIARRARELAPEMPVIYVTGGNAQEWASKGVPNSVLITKPFAPAQLITAVAMLLTEADRAAMVQPQTLGEIIIGPAQYLTWRRKACRTAS